MKHKIYCFNNGGSPGLMSAIAIADDGHVLGQHLCSHEGYMRHDLGMDGSTWKHKDYNKHFGEGNWELEWVDYPSPLLDAAFALNAKLSDADLQKQKEGQPGVTLEVSQ